MVYGKGIIMKISEMRNDKLIFVSITEHTPVQCPGFNKEALDMVITSIPKLPEV